MKKLFNKVLEARKTIEEADEKKVEFIREAYAAYTTEAAKMDDEMNFIGRPSECKTEWMAESAELGLMSNSEFEQLLAAMDVLGCLEACAIC